jgi:hypothetical protein
MIYCYHFTAKALYSYTYQSSIMAGVLEHLHWPLQKRPKIEQQVFPSYWLDLKALELDTAKEILREVFGTSTADVEEMIRQRLAERGRL